jgi:glycine/D-amino acid oxidase-like deaminating enzyme
MKASHLARLFLYFHFIISEIMIDVIIVGSGISGCSLYWELVNNGKTVHMISNTQLASSSVAAGVYNPTVLKRFTPVWKASEQLDLVVPFYKGIQETLGVNLLHPISILRRFHDEREARTWQRKSLRDDLKDFMHSNVNHYAFDGVEAAYGFGEVNGTGWLDTVGYMNATMDHVNRQHSLTKENFNYSQCEVCEGRVNYKDITSAKIIFADGFGMMSNPYFNYLPMQGNKGEVLTVRIPGLKLNHIIKSSVFLMPYKEDLFWVGATYDRDDLSYEATKSGLEYLISRLEGFLTLPYEIVDHKAGIRPTTIDRRPFLGSHPDHSNVYVFNGMGSRAVLVAPWASQLLYNSIYNDIPLLDEVDIKRFG